MRRALLVNLLLGAGLLPLAASAEKPPAVAVPLKAGTNISDAVASGFDQRFRHALAAHVAVADDKTTAGTLAGAGASPGGCIDADCARKVAAGATTRFVVTASVVNEDEIYKVTVAVFDALHDRITATKTQICELCAVNEVDDSIDKAITGVSPAFTQEKPPSAAPPPPPPPPPAAKLIVETEPPGADLTLDGEPVGKTPVALTEVSDGERLLVISLEGYESEEHTVVVGEEPTRLKIALKVIVDTTSTTPPPPPPLATEPGAGGHTLLSIALVGGGVALAGVGAYLLLLDGEITCDDGRGRTECPNVYDTKLPGMAAFGVGAAALGVGATLLLTRPGVPATSLGPAPDGTGAFLQIGGDF